MDSIETKNKIGATTWAYAKIYVSCVTFQVQGISSTTDDGLVCAVIFIQKTMTGRAERRALRVYFAGTLAGAGDLR